MPMTANYHTHTKRCGHASGEDREYVEAAIRAGIKVLGFADHVPLPPGQGTGPHIRMEPEQIGDYFDSLQALREEFADRIELHIGFEAEYFSGSFYELQAMLADWPCEYLLLGQHFLRDETGDYYAGRPFDDAGLLERYTDTVVAAIETGAFLYVAHPDLARFTGDEQVYLAQARRICRAAKEAGMPLEVNLLGMRELRWYPRGLFFEAAAEEGNKLILGLDAHSPKHFTDREAAEAMRDGLEFAESFGLELVQKIEI